MKKIAIINIITVLILASTPLFANKRKATNQGNNAAKTYKNNDGKRSVFKEIVENAPVQTDGVIGGGGGGGGIDDLIAAAAALEIGEPAPAPVGGYEADTEDND